MGVGRFTGRTKRRERLLEQCGVLVSSIEMGVVLYRVEGGGIGEGSLVCLCSDMCCPVSGVVRCGVYK